MAMFEHISFFVSFLLEKVCFNFEGFPLKSKYVSEAKGECWFFFIEWKKSYESAFSIEWKSHVNQHC